MRWLYLGIVLGACTAEAPVDSSSPTDDTSGDDDSGSETDDTAADAAAIERGAEIVQSLCNHCHGYGNSLAARIDGLGDDDIASVIRNGSGYMPAQDLDAGDIADVIAYLRATFPN